MAEGENIEIKRCVNLDWLEVYALEDKRRYPCNADFFRREGYFVTERAYGTRQYKEMFTIQDQYGEPFIEIRRNPFSGDSDFSGLNERSTHIRLVNRYCYFENAIRLMAEFLIRHDYDFQRIYRIDVAYDFRAFDYGDDPERFIRRYVEKKYSKVNQTKVRVFGEDGWSTIKWESVSWGSRTSMVNTKMYNKTKELAALGNSKPWIVQAWLDCGLIDRLFDFPDVWRIEFSMHSSLKNWLRIEDSDSKHQKELMIPHTLELFDGRDSLWQRFQDLAHHYFRFKYVEYNRKVNSNDEATLKRKDLCREKKLFKWDDNKVFYKVDNVTRETIPNTENERLRRAIIKYRGRSIDMNVRQSCDVIIKALEDSSIQKLTPDKTREAIEKIRLMLATRVNWNLDDVFKEADRILQLLELGEIW